MRWAGCAGLVAVTLGTWGVGVAHAHPLVDEAQRLYEEADFPGALAALERAEDAHDLVAEDVARLYATRAVIHRGMRDEVALDDDLVHLATVDHEYAFGSDVPPDLTARFQSIRARVPGLSLTAEPSVTADSIEIRPVVANDSASVIRETRIAGRVEGGTWQLGTDVLAIAAGPGDEVEYYVEAIGPGGAIVARVGSEQSPERTTVAPTPFDGDDGDEAGGGAAWIWIGVGAGAALAATIVIAILASGGDGQSDVTRPGAPMIVGM